MPRDLTTVRDTMEAVVDEDTNLLVEDIITKLQRQKHRCSMLRFCTASAVRDLVLPEGAIAGICPAAWAGFDETEFCKALD